MALAAGTRLGPYEVLAPLGAGGMGELYRARDSRLGREIALKILPAELSGDPSARARFEQEARAASALNHPNVVHVYDVGSSDSTIYIAMELIEGRTLRDVLGAAPLAAKKILDLALQILDGLARAHQAGIVHRDLKPENLMVSKDGHLYILDFGLAKLVEPPESDPAERPTSPQLTRSGMLLGTLGYMSPEQAASRSIDFRSDQFSLGTILYEMASGRRPFERATGAETLTAILREAAPPLAPIAPQLPAPLRWIIEERCLAKEPDARYASTRDLHRELHSLREHLSEASSAEVVARPESPRRRVLLTIALGLLVTFALGWLAGHRGATSGASPRFRRLTFRSGLIPTARFAPDGQTIVYGARFGDQPFEIFSTRTDSSESRSLGMPQASLLSISANGEMAISMGNHPVVGWETAGTLARVPLAGGAPREVLEEVEEADWSPDGRELAVVREVGGRRRLEFPIDNVLYETAGYVSHARVSPKGNRIAFLDHPRRGDNAGSVAVVDLAGKKRTLSVAFSGTDGLQWSPAGEEVWFSAITGGLHFDLRAVTLSGRERVVWRESSPVILRDIGRDGRVLMGRLNYGREIVCLAPGAASERGLSWLDWSAPADLSEDGQTLLFSEQGEGAGAASAIYVRKTDGSPAVRLGEGDAMALAPDGKSALGVLGGSLLLIPIGAGTPKTLPIGALTSQSADFLPDGRSILLAANEQGRASRLYLLDLSGGTPRPVTPEGVTLVRGEAQSVSPDGKWVATLGPDRRLRLYPLDGGAPREVPGISTDERAIRWTADGRGLYVHRVSVSPKIEIVDLATGRRAHWKQLAPAEPAGVRQVRPILISRDGKAYAYSYARWAEDLYLVEGLR